VIDFIHHEIETTIETFRRLAADERHLSVISRMGEVCAEALRRGNKIMLAGNGGSAADAQHIATEFVSRLREDREPLAALALTTDTSCLTAVSNDYGFEKVFARQIQALGKKGDVLVAISTSGNSPNILAALTAASEYGISSLGLTGKSGGMMVGKCDLLLQVPSSRTQNIQEVHIMVGHTICAISERSFLRHDSHEPAVSTGVA